MTAQTATRDHHQVLREADETQRKVAVAADAGAFELCLSTYTAGTTGDPPMAPINKPARKSTSRLRQPS